MAERTRPSRKLLKPLVTGVAAAGLSAALFPLTGAYAGGWWNPFTRKAPDQLPTAAAAARPLTVEEPLIQQTAGDRRLQRLKRKEQMLMDKAATSLTPPQEPASTSASQPQAAPQILIQPQTQPQAITQPQPIGEPAVIAAPTTAPVLSPAPVAAAPSSTDAEDAADEEDLENLFLDEGNGAAAGGTPELEFEAAPAPKPMSNVQKQLQKLYEQGGGKMPEMPDIVYDLPPKTGNAAGQPAAAQPAAQPQTVTTPAPQPIAIAQPAAAPQPATPPAAAEPKPGPVLDQTDPSAAALVEDPTIVPTQPKKGFLGLFNLRRSEEVVTPPTEPDPYVPPSKHEPAKTAAAPIEMAPTPPATGDQPAGVAGSARNLADQVIAPPLVRSVEPEPQAFPEAEPSMPPIQIHPLRARNYSQELFGEPASTVTVEESTPEITNEDVADVEVLVPEAPAPIDAPATETIADFDESAEAEESLNLDAEPAVETPPALELPTPEEESPAPVETETVEDPYSDLKLDSNPWADPAQEPAGDDRAVSAETAPQRTDIPVLLTPGAIASDSAARSGVQFKQVSARRGQTGLKGFCPVRLRDHRQLVDGSPEFRAEFRGRMYYLSSQTALDEFLAQPEKYAPALDGCDVIESSKAAGDVDGSLDHSVWYQGRLYLFATAEGLEDFKSAPAAYAVE